MIDLKTEIKIPELLAPAGNRDAFLAALFAGADAVYLGLGDFNARRNADNFDFETLTECCDLAHLAGRRVFLTLNTLVLPDEMNRALDTAKTAWDAGVDALIVQDLGLMQRLSYDMPQLELHASTQMNIHNTDGVRLAAGMGASRVTLSRELSLSEIATIARESLDAYGNPVPVEVFGHGALCVCYSGQCLFSSLVGRRSANRGLCAQACRLPYQLIDTSTGRRIKVPGEHLLSPADLATIDILPALCEAGVASVKIEGRMKSAAYVATVTRAYREVLDRLSGRCAEREATENDETPLDALAETFSRGFTTAYLEGDRGNDMMGYSRPNNQGVSVGRVSKLSDGLVAVTLTKDVVIGDVLEFRTSRGRSTVTLERFWNSADTGGKSAASLGKAEKGLQISLKVKDPVSIGDRVFRVRNAALLDEAESTFGNTVFKGNNGIVEVKAHVVARLGEPLQVGFTLLRGTVGSVDDPADTQTVVAGETVEAARSRTLTEEAIREHVGRVGGTPYHITSWDISLDEGVGAGFSELHRLRSVALEQLGETGLAGWRNRKLVAKERPAALAVARKGKVCVAVIVSDAAAAKAALRAGADMLYIHTLAFDAKETDRTEILSALKGFSAKTPIFGLLPAVAHDHDLASLIERVSPDMPLIANNLGEIKAFGDSGRVLEAGQSLNVTNEQSIRLLAELGLKQAWLSPELSCHNIAVLSPTSPLPLALTVFGRQEVMITEHCLLMAQGPCDRDCVRCARRKAPRLLEDRKGYKLPVRTDDRGRSHLFNAVSLDLIPSMPELVALGISTMVVDATLLTTKDIKAEVERTVRARDLAVRGAGSLPKREGYTTGHFFRGVH